MNDLDRMLKDIEKEVELTRHFLGKGHLDSRVMTAMKKTPRHEFLPEDLRFLAYENGPAPIGSGQTISQPYIVALMTDLLESKPEYRILEIGTGSGYQAAILSQLVAKVYSLEIIERLATDAGKRLNDLGYDNIEVRNDNGYYGWLEHAPFDGIIVTAAAPYIPQSLVDQLCIGARLVIPIGLPYGYQELLVVEKCTKDKVTSRTILGVRFVPMTGIHNKPHT